MKYKIKEIGLDTRNLDTTEFLEAKTLVTSPASGNDYILEPSFPEWILKLNTWMIIYT